MSDNSITVVEASKALVAAQRKLDSVIKKASKATAKAVELAEKRNVTKLAAAQAAVSAARATLASQLQ